LNNKNSSRGKFRALLLAAGYGTRLKPYTTKKPKSLMEIRGIPLLEYWLKNLENAGCEAVLINTHYLAEQIEEFLISRKISKMRIETVYEKDLLGTAGTLKRNICFFENKIGLLIHSDNYTNLQIDNLVNFHEYNQNDTILTMVTFKPDNPKTCGMVQVDSNNILIDFEEKPEKPKGSIANGAIYAFDSKFLNELKDLDSISDFSKDIICQFKGRIQTYFTNNILIDIGNPKSLEKARKTIF